MKKRILVALASTLTVGAFAQGMMNNQQGMMGGQNQQHMWNKQGMQNQGMMNFQQGRHHGKGMMGGQGMGMMSGGMQMFSQLNLTDEQTFQLSILKDEMRLDMKKLMYSQKRMGQMGEFIKGDSFDKSSFKKHMNVKHEKMLDLRANNMEKAFKILTREQVAELKKNLTTK